MIISLALSIFGSLLTGLTYIRLYQLSTCPACRGSSCELAPECPQIRGLELLGVLILILIFVYYLILRKVLDKFFK